MKWLVILIIFSTRHNHPRRRRRAIPNYMPNLIAFDVVYSLCFFFPCFSVSAIIILHKWQMWRDAEAILRLQRQQQWELHKANHIVTTLQLLPVSWYGWKNAWSVGGEVPEEEERVEYVKWNYSQEYSTVQYSDKLCHGECSVLVFYEMKWNEMSWEKCVFLGEENINQKCQWRSERRRSRRYCKYGLEITENLFSVRHSCSCSYSMPRCAILLCK